MTYLYRWDRQGRKGRHCEVLARGKMNSCLVRFADGYTMVTSRNAICRAKDSGLARLKIEDLRRRAKLQEIIDRQDAERGRPLTATEKLENLRKALKEHEDE